MPKRLDSVMTWESYSGRFSAAARKTAHSEEYIQGCLSYGERLWARGLPIIYDIDHFSALVGYSRRYILMCAHAADAAYRPFAIKKKSGGKRVIHEPLPSLKEIQRWMLKHILYAETESRFAKGFVRGRGVLDNARFHLGQPVVLSLDIAGFFPSLKWRWVFRLFREFGYSRAVAGVLSHLCTLDGSLPQGAPTSPAISNLLLKDLDRRIGGFALARGIRYTRYADDMTFSGDFSPGRVILFVEGILRGRDLRLNDKKTRTMRPHNRQEVTGIVVNERLRAPRKARRELRTAMHYIRRFGLGAHLAQIGETRVRYLFHLMGVANWILHVDPDDAAAADAMAILRELATRSAD